MANKKPTKTTFTADKQPAKRRGKSERTKFLEALARNNYSEDEFYDHLVLEAMKEKSPIAMGEILKRVSPITKAVAPMIEFKMTKSAKAHVKAGQILDAIASGEVPPDIGTMLISSIKAMVDIEEYTDLKARIEKLEAVLNGDKS